MKINDPITNKQSFGKRKRLIRLHGYFKKKKQMHLSDVHKFPGSHVSYAIKTVGDDPCDAFCVNVGSTSDIEMRMMNHESRARARSEVHAGLPTHGGEPAHS